MRSLYKNSHVMTPVSGKNRKSGFWRIRTIRRLTGLVLVIFMTGRAAGWTFLVYGDSQSAEPNHREVLRSMVRMSPSYRFIINCGDVVVNGYDSRNWDKWKASCETELGTLGQSNTPPSYMACPGNHDELQTTDGLNNWVTYLPGQAAQFGNSGKYFYFDYEIARFIILDSESTSRTGAQLNMLMNALKTNTKTWVFVFWHRPVFNYSTNTAVHQYEDGLHDDWASPLNVYGCDIIFMGHAHYYVRMNKIDMNGDPHPPLDSERGTVHLVNGNGGATLTTFGSNQDGNGYMLADHFLELGYTEISISGNQLTLRHIARRTDQIMDQVTYTANPKGSYAPRPPADLGLTRLSGGLQFDWSAVSQDTSGRHTIIDNYTLLRAPNLLFTAGETSEIYTGEQLTCTDAGAPVNDAGNNAFYKVRAVNVFDVGSEWGSVAGEFDYQLITTGTTDFNEIALPLSSNIQDAEDLMAAIPHCNSVARWNASFQGYEQYVPAISSTNFPVQPGYPYYVNVTANTIWSLTGEPASPQFSLITTATTDFNEIMLPLDRPLAKASDLMADIPNCNSVARWNASFQGYEQYVPAISSTNFDLQVGHPYYVNVTANTVWPAGTGKRNPEPVDGNTGGRSQAPHTVWGNAGMNVERNQMTLRAWIQARPHDFLSQMSPGSILSDHYWAVQCASFDEGWEAGEILMVVLEGETTRQTWSVILTHAPVDSASSVDNESDTPVVPRGFIQAYPNPFNSQASIFLSLPQSGQVTVRIFDLLGREVITLYEGRLTAGPHEWKWNGTDRTGRPVGSGQYLIRVETDDSVYKHKIVLMK